MSDGVIYMNTGLKHANHVVISLFSLRDHWKGPVALIAGCDQSEQIFRYCIDDGRLGDLELIRWNAPTRKTSGFKSGTQYANKCEMGKLSPFERTVFLDADTLVVDDISDAFPRELTEEVRLTWFADWWTTDRRMMGRIEPWRDVALREVSRSLANKLPAINTGVIGFTSLSTKWFEAWREMTLRNVGFICDEIAAQLIFPDHPHCILDERWNASVIFSVDKDGKPKRQQDIRIWHGHGFKFLKKPTGRALWMPYYERAVAEGIARINEWTNDVPKAPLKMLEKVGWQAQSSE